jgi:hypothetical protein
MPAREHINWNQHYGKAFRVAVTPKGASVSMDGKNIPDEEGRVSIVTPANGDAWTDWEEAPEHVVNSFKSNWGSIQKTLADHKYGQIKSQMV